MQAIYIYYKVLCTPSHPDITNNHPIHPTYSTTVLHQFEMAFFFFEIGCNVIYVKMLVIFKLRTARFRREATHGCQSLWWAQECHEKLRRRRYRDTHPPATVLRSPRSCAQGDGGIPTLPLPSSSPELCTKTTHTYSTPMQQTQAQSAPKLNKHNHNLMWVSTRVRVQSWQKITK